MTLVTAQDILHFWFEELDPKQWFRRDDALDRQIHDRFATTHAAASRCELYAWRETPTGRLAEIIVLDQFSRNLYREEPRAFAQDALALALSQEAIFQNVDQTLSASQKAFLYMPFMHSESAVIHEMALKLFDQPGLENNLDFEIQHKAIIDQFGRYPHRNAMLGRPSTEAELAFLQNPGAGF
ncbi:MAG: DUF924 domain-containing protein [Gammaproteobacteria bacterium]|nr:MAG: DUF924 domain-containing protein [Gammaproteobacteria bacterium]